MRHDDSAPETPGNCPDLPCDRPVRRSSNERAFVVQFDEVRSARSRLSGRAEVVGSGEHTRFRSLKGLVEFMVLTLRKPPHNF